MIIVQYSIPRSGSTLLYNVLRNMCMDNTVVKTHYPTANIGPVFISLRDFRECIASWWRFNSDFPAGQVQFSHIIRMIIWMKLQIHRMNTYHEQSTYGRQVKWIMYKELKNVPLFIDKLESTLLEMGIDMLDRSPHSIAKMVQEQIDSMTPESLAYKNQRTGETPWKETIPERYHKLITRIFWNDLLKYGFTPNRRESCKDV